jgi:eukaryotic-like serine/threonine-protein kinase
MLSRQVDRDAEVKVPLGKRRDGPEMVRRLVKEARTAGQLEHPGIVPVYGMGRLPDARLSVATKLTRGRTLAASTSDDENDLRVEFAG